MPHLESSSFQVFIPLTWRISLTLDTKVVQEAKCYDEQSIQVFISSTQKISLILDTIVVQEDKRCGDRII